jgi:protein-S-isoprenylcysteine O-methyltransferase Ste14
MAGTIDSDDSKSSDHPNVIALPPLIYLTALIIGVIANFIDPRPLFPGRIAFWVGAAMVVACVSLAVWARVTMKRAGTNINPYEPALQIVTAGPYGFTRNPMYLAMVIGYLGVVLMVNGVWPAVVTIPLVWTIQWGVIAREESYLDARFGETYRSYRARVRRWL